MSELNKKYTKKYLEELMSNPEKLKLEAYLSKGLVYKYFKDHNIEITKELVMGEAFNIFAIYELENLLKSEGLEDSNIEKFIIEQVKQTHKNEFYSKELTMNQIAYNNKEEFIELSLVHAEELLKKYNLKDFIKEHGLSEYISIEELEKAANLDNIDVKKELLLLIKNNKLDEAINWYNENKNHPELDETKLFEKEIEEIFNFELAEVGEHVANNNQQEVDLFLNKWISFIENDKNRIINTYNNRTKERIIKNIVNKVPFDKLNDFAIESLNVLKISYAKGEGRKKLRNELEKIIYEKNLYKKDFSFNVKDFSFNVINALKLDWEDDADRKLFIDFIEKFKKEKDLLEKFKLTEIYKQISEDDIEKYIPILTEKFLDLDDSEKNKNFVIEKFKKLYSEKDVPITSFVSFFLAKEKSYYDTFYFNYDEVLENLVKSLLEDDRNIYIPDLSYGTSSVNETKSFMFMKVFNAVVKFDKDFYKKLTMVQVESLMQVITEREYYNYKIVKNNFPVVLEFEKNINEAIKFIIDNNYKNEIHSILENDIPQSMSSELTNILTISLLTKKSSMSSNELIVLSSLLNDRVEFSKSYHSNDSTKELLEQGFTVTDLLGESLDILKNLENQSLVGQKFSTQEIVNNILNNIDSSYDLESRSRLSSKNTLKNAFLILLMDKVLDRNRNADVNDVEYGQMLYVFENKFHYQMNDEVKTKLEKLKKQYPWNKTFSTDFILNKYHNLDLTPIEKNKDLFLSQFNKKNVYSDTELNKIVEELIAEEKKSYTSSKKVDLYYSVVNKIKEINSLNNYPKTKESLLKVVKREDYKPLFESVISSVKERVGINKKTYSLIDILNFKLDLENKDDFVDILDKVGFETLNKVEVYSEMIINDDFEKLNIIIEHFYKRKELSNVFSNLSFTLQEKALDSELFKNKSLSDDSKHFYGKNEFSFKLNCTNFEEFKKAIERLKPEEQRKLLLNGGKYYGNVDAYLWEGGKVLDKIKFSDDKEIVSYIIDNFPLSIMDSFSLGRLPFKLQRSFSPQELISLYRNIKKKAGSIFSSTENVNASIDWLEIYFENNNKKSESILVKNEKLKEFVENLEKLKEEPLLYILYLYENHLFIDQLSYSLVEKKDENSYASNNYRIAKISPNVSPMYELLELLKSYPETNEMFNSKKTEFDEGFINTVFYKNFVDFDILVKGLTEGLQEMKLVERTNSRLTDMVSYIYKYELSYSKKIDRTKDFGGETVKEVIFEDSEVKKLINEIGKINPGVLMSYGLARQLFSKTEEAKDCNLNQEDLSEEDARKLARFIIDNYFDDSDLKEVLNSSFNFYSKKEEIFFDEILNKTLKQVDNDFVENINYSEKVFNKSEKYLQSEKLSKIYSYSSMLEEGLAYNLLKRDDSSLVQSFIDRSQMSLDVEKPKVTTARRSRPVKF